MKTFKVLSFALLTLLVVTSCNNVENILTKKTGTWNIKTQTSETFVGGTSQGSESETNVGTFTFNDDGTGSSTQDDSTFTFNWTYNKDQDQVTITDQGLALVWDVLESSKKEQKWTNTFEIEFLGVTTRTVTEVTLERQD